MSLLIHIGDNDNKYKIILKESTYSSYLSKDVLEFTVKNIHCNTCDDIIEQVFRFVDTYYKEEKPADASFLTALQEKAKDALNKHLETEKK